MWHLLWRVGGVLTWTQVECVSFQLLNRQLSSWSGIVYMTGRNRSIWVVGIDLTGDRSLIRQELCKPILTENHTAESMPAEPL